MRFRSRGAIVGAGLMGRWHAHALRRIGIPVAAVVDADPARARRLAPARSRTRVHESLASLLKDGGADVVHICTPLHTHHALVRQALDAGMHVIVEKPLAGTADETVELYRLARTVGVYLCPVHQMPFQSGVSQLRRRLPELGSLCHVEATHCSAGGTGKPAVEQAEIAADILPHPLSLFECLLPVPLDSINWQSHELGPGELRIYGQAPKISTAILISMHGRPPVNSLRVIGDRASAHVDLFHGFLVVEQGGISRMRKAMRPFSLSGRTLAAAAGNLANRAIRVEPAYPGLVELVRRFYLAVEGHSDLPITEDEAVRVARIRERLRHQVSPLRAYHTSRPLA